MQKFFYPFIVLLFIFTNCSKEEESYIIVKPTIFFEEVSCGDILNFDIEGFSNGAFRSFEISLKPEKEFSLVLFDTLLEASKFNIYLEIEIPVLAESFTEANLVFRAIEENGNVVSFTRLLYISNLNKLNETAGHEIFSSLASNSNAFDAFSLATNTALHSDIADSSIMNIKEATDSSMWETGTLSREWRSPSGAKFVRFNDFDFGNADQSDLILSFRAGRSSPFIDQLEEKDIILVEYRENDSLNSYCAIKINSIIDDVGVENDRYFFDIKK